jgi:hypothetical protein
VQYWGIMNIYLCESGRLNLNVNKVVENKWEMVMDEDFKVER